MFDNLVEFSSYNAEFLRGKGLIVTEHNDLGLAIVRYHKGDNAWKTRTHGECDRADPVVRNHRSVVYSLESGLPLSVAPIRRIPNDLIGNSDLNEEDSFVVTEYLDGTMIHVFWNPNTDAETGEPLGWTLASRSKIHATCRFTSDRLFRDLFEEAREKSGVSYESLNQKFSYTFMLVHPETRRVISYDSPRIVLVSMVGCVPKITGIADESDLRLSARMVSWENMTTEANRIAPDILPKEITELVDANDVLNYSLCDDVAHTLSGWMITKKSGSWGRVRILTDGFETCASLRGDTASRTTNYLRLMSLDPQGDAIQQYAAWYPQETDAIQELSVSIQSAIKELIQSYVDRHVKKTKEHGDLPHWTRRPIWDLHGRYLRTRVPIRDTEVFAYFRDISPSVVNRMLKNRDKENRRVTQGAAAAAAASDAAAPG